MAAALALVLALVGGASLTGALGALTIPQLIALAQFGAQAGVSGIKVAVAVNKELDRRFPCNKHCQKVAEAANLRAMEQYGWRHPYVGGRHNP